MHYDAVIIGAGMSGLAAGIRLAYFDKRVCLVEKHTALGGLNSYYRLHGRIFDVGLHALTNFVPPDRRSAPLPKLLRQLRLSREEWELGEQRFSEIRFPGRRLRFTNDIQFLIEEVAREFPKAIDGFRRLLAEIEDFDDTRLDHTHQSARRVVGEYFEEQTLTDMLLCPVTYYGSAAEHDMDYTQFVTIFKSLFFEGLARPRRGVLAVIKTLAKKFQACGGAFKLGCGVERLEVEGRRVVGVTLESGETITADIVLSSAGYFETMMLCADAAGAPPRGEAGRISFVESIAVLDEAPARSGHEATIVFFNEVESFEFARPAEPVDLRSGVICCPNNYVGHEDMDEGLFRLTWLANPDRWMDLDELTYRATKEAYGEKFLERGEQCIPGFRRRIVARDMFTPRTIRHYTGHLNGAVYGAPQKFRDGRTRLENLFICGTDQGFLGIIGAMLSGITMANLHVLSET